MERTMLDHFEMPKILRLELTNTCDLACPHCRHHSIEKRKPENYKPYYQTPIYMTEEQVSAIFEEVAPYNTSVTLNVANEPLIAPTFPHAIREIKKNGLVGTFNTNGMTMNEKFANLLVETEYDSVNISIDAFTAEILKKARGVRSLKKLIKNIELLIKIRGEKLLPRIGVTFVITDYNDHELPDFLDFWKTKVDVIRVTGYISDNKPDVSVIPGATKEDMPDRVPCKQLFRDIVIRANGDVTPCVITAENPDIVIGNIFKDGGVKAVWNGEGLNKLRELHNQGRENEISFCSPCDYWLDTLDMEEREDDDFLIRTPSPYTTFYNVKSRLRSWNKDLHDRQGTDI